MKQEFNKNFNLFKSSTEYSFATLILILALYFTTSILAQGSGKALDFDGIDDYVNVPDHNSLDATFSLTIEAWIKTNSTSDVQQIVCKWSELDLKDERSYRLTVTSSNLCEFAVCKDGKSGKVDIVNGSSAVGTGWCHIAGVFDDDSLKVYLNGIKDGSDKYDYPGSGILAGQAPLRIGQRMISPTQSTDYFNGNIVEVRIWNGVRTEDQIRETMCKKLTGSETGLVGYWRLDEGSESTANDETSNNNDGTLTNMDDSDWLWSGAPIGDASAYDYTGTNPADFSAALSHGDGDDLTTTGDGGTLTGIQVYRVDTTSLRQDATAPSGWTLDPLRYWGVFAVGSSPTYSITYNYDGHPGITNESDLGLAYRDDQSDNSWADVAATLNTSANTLTKTTQSGSEYTLGSKTGDNPLPVELSAFRADIIEGVVQLYWRTESEIENVGFILKRSENKEAGYQEIASYQYNDDLRGHFNSNTAHEYSFKDEYVKKGYTYWYKLVDVDLKGARNEHGPISITIEGNSSPNTFTFYSAYPNPFNPLTTLKFDISTSEKVKREVQLTIYDVMGQKIKMVFKGSLSAGTYNFNWAGEADSGAKMASGVYMAVLSIDNHHQIQKLILLK